MPPAPLRPTLLAAALLTAAAVAAYSNSFSGPFVYDDSSSILTNPTIRSLWPPWAPFAPPPLGLTVSGRPVLNFSLALSYAISGEAVWSYHALNLLFHVLAGLTLFGLLRRTLQTSVLAPRFGRDALPLSLGIALLWTLHPLQTESVTYTIQRAESLCGLFFLATFYSFARGATPGASPRWFVASVAACALGMATKEVMATAPVLLLFYDRTFFADSFRSALRQRARWHLALAATWIVVGLCVLSTGGNRGGAVGLGTGVSWWDYGLTQFPALTRYLALTFWPAPLVFDYGTFWVTRAAEVVAPLVLILALIAATLVGLLRRSPAGFAGAFFFTILAPTSLVPGTTQMIVEHRVYLSLAAVLALVVLGAHRWLGRSTLPVCLGLSLALGVATFRRNADYHTEAALWADTVAKRPANALAHHNLGVALLKTDAAAAVPHFATAVQLKPDYLDARQNLATSLLMLGRLDAAIAAFTELLSLFPGDAEARSSLALALHRAARPAEALAHARESVRLQPHSAAIRLNFANLLGATDRPAEAVPEFETALRLDPSLGLAHFGLGHALLALSRTPEALVHFERCLQLLPDFAPARTALAAARQTGAGSR